MQSSSKQLAEDHDHSSNIETLAQHFENSIFLHEDQELSHDAGETGDAETEDAETGEAEDEEEFSFTFDGSNGSPIAAEDLFVDGKIKPMYPLFNQDLLLEDQYFEENLTQNPKMKKVLFEMKRDLVGNDEISGPYCEWKGKSSASSEGDHERCKKSNSTGFSKLWRLKEVVNRSNSDGRDAFVFLKGGKDGEKIIKGKTKTTSSDHHNGVSLRRKEEKKAVVGGGGGGEEVVVKRGKSKTTSLSAHEIYLKNKAKENDRKKVYKPEVFGFFTNVNGGISKNVHPY